MAPLKQAEQGSRGVNVLGVYEEYLGVCGSVVVLWGCRDGTHIWNTYNQ